jgi:DNA-binding HxlR family transcriptional regulator
LQKIISGKYRLRILWDLREGPRRYGEIRHGLRTGSAGSKDVTPRVLSRELKALTTLGMIERKDFRTVPPKVEYVLTAEGRSLVPVLSVMHAWGIQHLVREELLKKPLCN